MRLAALHRLWKGLERRSQNGLDMSVMAGHRDRTGSGEARLHDGSLLLGDALVELGEVALNGGTNALDALLLRIAAPVRPSAASFTHLCFPVSSVRHSFFALTSGMSARC